MVVLRVCTGVPGHFGGKGFVGGGVVFMINKGGCHLGWLELACATSWQ